MSSERNVTRVVESWLEEGPAVLPDRVLDAVEARLAATHQRRAGWLARRFPIMNSSRFRFGIAAAAVVVLALIGWRFLPGSNTGGGPTATPTPTLSPTPSPIRSVAATPVGLPEGEIPPGRYHLTEASIRYSFALSSELWQSSQPGYSGFIETRAAFPNPGFAWITPLSRLDAVSADPCAGTETRVTSVDDAVTALTQIAGTDAAAPIDLTVDGVPGKLVVLTISGDFACDQTSFWLYGNGSFYPNDPDSVIRDWVFDLDGQTYLFHTDQIGSDAALGDEIQQIIGSIQFE